VPGVAIPYPYGGKQRVVSVDLDLKALEATNLVQTDVVTALNNGFLTYPSGTAKIGGQEVPIDLNVNPPRIDLLNDLPIKLVGGTVIYIKDVAQVRDGYMPQENVVRQNGIRSSLLTIFKNGAASTLSVAEGVKAAMANVLTTVTSDVEVKQFADQSVFVKAAVRGVVKEGVIAAALTALMILLFLGSWRSTLIIAVSIPLSVLSSLAILSVLGQTINIMTLGGLALAVGILVDDATVTIENVERHLASGEKLEDGILKGAGEIALPAMVSTFCICIVFVPMFSLAGVARYLFVPLAEAVMFAVISSYVLSRTLVPTLIMFFERHHQKRATGQEKRIAFWVRPLVGLQQNFERAFDRLREAYGDLLGTILKHRGPFAIGCLFFSWHHGTSFLFSVRTSFPRLTLG
jgi:multidrug efflux pump subunit AcrB